jgi:5-methylcytosine-specific restriction endonuclease McrA
MENTLVLAVTYEPLKIINWQRAMTLFVQEKAEIVETHDREARSVSFTFKVPSVIRLLYMVKLRKRPVVQFTRVNIYNRDNWTCQYCAEEKDTHELTFDHVVPVTQGGQRGWTNIVTCCVPCNRKKGGRTPAEAGMKLLHQPRRPLVMAPVTKINTSWRTPETWLSYLYWNAKLET